MDPYGIQWILSSFLISHQSMIDESNPTRGTKADMDYFHLSIVLLMFAQLDLISHKTLSGAIEVGK